MAGSAILAVIILITLVNLLIFFRKPIKVIQEYTDDYACNVLPQKLDMMANEAVVAAKKHKKECEERLREAGIEESLEEICQKYSHCKRKP